MGNTMNYRGKSIGMQSLTAWKITDDIEGGETTYEATPIKVGRAITATLTPSLATAFLESEDGIEDDLAMVSGYGLNFGVSQFSNPVRAELFGHELDANGGVVVRDTDQPPLIALAWKTLLSSEKGGQKAQYAYFLLYKGRLKDFAENFETKRREGFTFQTHEGVEGTFFRRDSDGLMYYMIREDDPNFNAEIASAWFNTPQVPTPVVDPDTP